MAGRKVEEVDRWRVEVNVEASLDTLEDSSLVDIVVAGVDDAGSLRPALLGGSNSCPEDSLAAAACITVCGSVWPGILFQVMSYQNGWKKPTMPSHCLSCWSRTRPSVATDAISSQS